jgi:hypothetical protein
MFGDPPSEWLHPDAGAMPRDFLGGIISNAENNRK